MVANLLTRVKGVRGRGIAGSSRVALSGTSVRVKLHSRKSSGFVRMVEESAAPQYPWSRGWDWINKGTELFLAAPWTWISVLILQLIIGIGISMTPTPDGPSGWVLDILLEMVGLVVGVLFDAGLLLGCDAIRRGEPLRIETLFAAFRHPAALALIKLGVIQVLAWAALATIALFLAAILVVGGSSVSTLDANSLVEAVLRSLGSAMIIFLFVTTLALLLVMAMWMAPPLMLFRGYTPTRALAESFNANFRNVRALTVYGLGMVGLAFVAMLPLLLGFLIWLPLATTTRYAAFLDLFDAPVGTTAQTVRAL